MQSITNLLSSISRERWEKGPVYNGVGTDAIDATEAVGLTAPDPGPERAEGNDTLRLCSIVFRDPRNEFWLLAPLLAPLDGGAAAAADEKAEEVDGGTEAPVSSGTRVLGVDTPWLGPDPNDLNSSAMLAVTRLR